MAQSKHYAAAVTAFVVWGFFAVPLRALQDYSSGEILFFRILFSFGILLVVCTVFRKDTLARDWSTIQSLAGKNLRRWITITITGGVLLTLNWLIFIYVVNHVNVKTASFAYLICPVITAILGFMILQERLTMIQWIAVGMCAMGCLVIGYGHVSELGYSLITALTYALYLISQRRNQVIDRMNALWIQVSISLVVLSVIFPFMVDSVPQESRFYLIVLIIAALFTVLPLFLNLFALNQINSATIGILMYLNPLFNFSVAFIVFDEKTDAALLTGYAIILAALVVFNIPVLRSLKTRYTATR